MSWDADLLPDLLSKGIILRFYNLAGRPVQLAIRSTCGTLTRCRPAVTEHPGNDVPRLKASLSLRDSSMPTAMSSSGARICNSDSISDPVVDPGREHFTPEALDGSLIGRACLNSSGADSVGGFQDTIVTVITWSPRWFRHRYGLTLC